MQTQLVAQTLTDVGERKWLQVTITFSCQLKVDAVDAGWFRVYEPRLSETPVVKSTQPLKRFWEAGCIRCDLMEAPRMRSECGYLGVFAMMLCLNVHREVAAMRARSEEVQRIGS